MLLPQPHHVPHSPDSVSVSDSAPIRIADRTPHCTTVEKSIAIPNKTAHTIAVIRSKFFSHRHSVANTISVAFDVAFGISKFAAQPSPIAGPFALSLRLAHEWTHSGSVQATQSVPICGAVFIAHQWTLQTANANPERIAIIAAKPWTFRLAFATADALADAITDSLAVVLSKRASVACTDRFSERVSFQRAQRKSVLSPNRRSFARSVFFSHRLTFAVARLVTIRDTVSVTERKSHPQSVWKPHDDDALTRTLGVSVCLPESSSVEGTVNFPDRIAKRHPDTWADQFPVFDTIKSPKLRSIHVTERDTVAVPVCRTVCGTVKKSVPVAVAVSISFAEHQSISNAHGYSKRHSVR